MARYDFASDNTAPIAPEALQAYVAANSGFAPSYGADPTTAHAADLIRALLDTDAEVRFVASGTAANSIALAALCRPFEAVVAHGHAHVTTDETGAPGHFGHGLGILPVGGASGRMDGVALAEAIAGDDSPHAQSPAVLSLTNATEYGTVYSSPEIAALTAPAKAKGLNVHLDGARLFNAAAAGFDLTTIGAASIDILVMGGTKAGMPPTEAMVIFDRALVRRFDARLKQSGQLPSKSRFYAAPFVGMLEDGAVLRHADHANAMAQRLAERMPFPVAHAVEANAVFIEMDEPARLRLQDAGWLAYRFLDGSVRFMCSWATTAETVDAVSEALKAIR